ncbi:MAG: hypothetical protein JXA18_13480 [Chitinispirillaceae bacterium]|nr:hypothetical protein [Chitinispirillaceae bacterium]
MYPSKRMLHIACLKRMILHLSLFIVTIVFKSFGYFPDASFLPFADSLFALESDTQVTSLRVKKVVKPKALRVRKKTYTYFMVTTCKTIHQPFSAVIDKVRSTDLYPEYFSFITKAVLINEGKDEGPVTMFIGAYGLYRVYFFGKIREEYSADSSHYKVFCGDVEQKKYRKSWRKRVRGMIKIGSHDVDIFWTVEKRGESSCRVSLTASQSFATRIPNWMVSIGTNKIFRGMLKDLEKYLAKAAPKPVAPAPAPETPTSTPDTLEPIGESPAPTPEAPASTPEAPASKPEAPASKPEAPASKPEAPASKPEAPVSVPKEDTLKE